MALTDNLVSYYKLDESSGNAADSVGSNTLTNNNTVGYAAAKINNGADFGSANSTKFLSYDAGNMWNGTSGTISCWVNITTAPASGERQMIAVLGDSASDTTFHINYKNESGTLKLEFDRFKRPSDGSDPVLNVTQTLTTGTWYHIVATYGSNTTTAYLNGTSIGTASGAGGNGSSLTTGNRIGAWLGNTEYLKGLVDEVGIWSRALTSTEITELYNSGDGKRPMGVDFTISEALAMSETSTNLRARNFTTSETLAMSETTSALKGLLFTISETIGLTETITSLRTLLFNVAENIGLTEVLAQVKLKWNNLTKSSSSWTNTTKNTSTFTNQSKNSSNWTNTTKN